MVDFTDVRGLHPTPSSSPGSKEIRNQGASTKGKGSDGHEKKYVSNWFSLDSKHPKGSYLDQRPEGIASSTRLNKPRGSYKNPEGERRAPIVSEICFSATHG